MLEQVYNGGNTNNTSREVYKLTENKYNIGNYSPYDTTTITDGNKEYSIAEIVDILNKLHNENEQLKKENLDLLEDLAYYKTKSASLEVDYLQYQKVNSGEVTTKKTIT